MRGMQRNVKSLAKTWAILTLAFGLIAVAVYATTAAPGNSQTVDATVWITSTTTSPGWETDVDLAITPGSGVTVGTVVVDVAYDGALVSVFNCSVIHQPGDCEPFYGYNNIRLTFGPGSPVIGALATVQFHAGWSEGSAYMDVTVDTCADIIGDPLNCVAEDGTITIQQPSPTPTWTPSPTPPPPTPSPTPKIWGDVNCNGAVTAVDALAILRSVAGLPVSTAVPCPTIGAVDQ